MEQEIIKYRQASFKGKLVSFLSLTYGMQLQAKKFSRFYINDFYPITELEEKDVKRARHNYRSFTFIMAITCGLLSFKYRRMKMSMIEPHEAPRDPNLFTGYLNDAVSVMVGYMFGHIVACDYIYKRRAYVIERLYYERNNDINRRGFEGQERFKEYPWADQIPLEYTDKEIIEDRLHPREVRENSEKLRLKMEKINQEYKEELERKQNQEKSDQ